MTKEVIEKYLKAAQATLNAKIAPDKSKYDLTSQDVLRLAVTRYFLDETGVKDPAKRQAIYAATADNHGFLGNAAQLKQWLEASGKRPEAQSDLTV